MALSPQLQAIQDRLQGYRDDLAANPRGNLGKAPPKTGEYENVDDRRAYDEDKINQTQKNYDDQSKLEMNDSLENQLGQVKANANRVSQKAKDFRTNIPNYTNTAISGATDTSRAGLANDIEAVKTNANSRGLLYSGVKAQGEGLATANASGKLAGNIQNINTKANSQADQLDQLSTKAQGQVANSQVALSGFQATQNQTAYQQALEQMKNNNSFISDIFSGAASVGTLTALLAL